MSHVGLLAWSGYRHSPTVDEVGHLPAGISHWHFGRFDVYRVNPPLVRTIAALPVVLCSPRTDWSDLEVLDRPEWALGHRFVQANPGAFWYFTLARWACIPLSVLGAWICYWWAKELYGLSAGLIAACLWCLSPNVLAHASLITPDAGAAAVGTATQYLFWRWLRQPSWKSAVSAGLVFGLALLTKTTWIVLFGLWPVLWFFWTWAPRVHLGFHEWRRRAGQMSLICLTGLYVLNAGYGFDGVFRRLGEFQFRSRALTSLRVEGERRVNRFVNTWVHNLPVPLPEQYVYGIDVQKAEFDKNKRAFLGGEYKRGGWWYYYIYGLAVKGPLGTWGLACLAMIATACCRTYCAGWRNEAVLLAPAVIVLVLVSSQTGINRHLRYILPVLPFGFIWISKVGRSLDLQHWRTAAISVAALSLSVCSSLSVYPHSLSYFNELVGGPTRGHYYLDNSNVDWGQDMLYLKEWHTSHMDARPLYVDLSGELGAGDFGMNAREANQELKPGWYAISVNKLHSVAVYRRWFLEQPPDAHVGYSIRIYRVAGNRARRPAIEMEYSDEHPSPDVVEAAER